MQVKDNLAKSGVLDLLKRIRENGEVSFIGTELPMLERNRSIPKFWFVAIHSLTSVCLQSRFRNALCQIDW